MSDPKPKDILFSVHEYDRDGDITERGIFLHFGSTRVHVATTLQDFRSIVGHFESMVDEIEQNYPEVDE